MLKLKRESVTKTYRENNILVETVKQFHYSTQEERLIHLKEMRQEGFVDSGKEQENIGSIVNPNYVWFGSYYKAESKVLNTEEEVS